MRRILIAVAVLGSLATVGCKKHRVVYPCVVIEQANPNPFVGKSRFYAHRVDYANLRIGNKTEEEYVDAKEDESAQSFEADKVDVAERYHLNLVRASRQWGLKVKEPKSKSTATGLSARELLMGAAAAPPPTFSLIADGAEAKERQADEVAPPAKKRSADDEFDGEDSSEAVAEGPFVIKPQINFMEPGFFAWVASSSSRITVNVKIEDRGGRLLDEIEITKSWAASTVDAASGTRYRKIADVLGRITADYLEHRTNPPPPED